MLDNVHYKGLNPISFLDRSATVYPDKTAITYGDKKYTYSEFYGRVNRLAGALEKSEVGRGDRVAFLVPNIPPMLEGHYGPLKIGAVLVAINIRLSSREISYILNHSGAKILVFDSEFGPVIEEIKGELPHVRKFVQVVDTAPRHMGIDGPEYEEFISSSTDGEHRKGLESELDAIAINYTSGTTGMPKGVQYHSRGAYLAALGEVLESGMTFRSNYLWTLPMFHCNGWCYTCLLYTSDAADE